MLDMILRLSLLLSVTRGPRHYGGTGGIRDIPAFHRANGNGFMPQG
ncbi:hypothetical protein OGR47_01490 [Methylocystis sp. MJC1]|jgi:hypothetical protein|nr:hypothetical protein [Methylocystis sp. MJC1]MBU6525685.1 hypothetical protein [Methylocystis sp. MJC1]UZX12157.1 hypothetical protein OGR47_01490 [Methylocystis sp. MJC1]